MSPARTVRAVVFDLFHTLVDPERHRPADFDRIGEAAGIVAIDPDRLRDLWEAWIPDLLRTPARPADRIVAAAGRDPDPDVVAAVDDVLGRHQDAAILAPEPTVVPALAALRSAGLRLGLLSNAHERDIRAWDRSPLASRFDVAGFSCHLGAAKPEPGAYRRVLAALGTPPETAVFAGDGNGDELPGARAVGFSIVICVTGPALRSGLRSEAEMAAIAGSADAVVADVSEIPRLLGIGGSG